MKTFFRRRYWLGWWYGSICSAHRQYDSHCPTCQAGWWTWQAPVYIHIERKDESGYIVWRLRNRLFGKTDKHINVGYF